MKTNKDYIGLLQQYEMILVSCVVLATVCALSVFFLLPNIEKAQMIYTKQQDLKTRLSKLKAKDNILSEIDGEFYRDIYAKMNYVLPNSKDYVSLFSTFDLLEQKTGVRFLRTDVQLGVVSTGSATTAQHVAGSAAYMLPVGMDVMGDMASFYSLFSALTDLSGRLLTLENIQMGRNGPGVYRATLSGKAYYYPLPASLGSLDTPLEQISQERQMYLQKIAEVKIASPQDTTRIEVGKKNLFQ